MSNKPGRKPSISLSQKKNQLSSDAKIIYALYKKQPQTKEELYKNTGIKIRTFYRVSQFLRELNIIKCTEDLYSLFEFEFLEKQIEDFLIKTLNHTWRVSFETVANEFAKPQNEIEALTRKVGKKMGLIIISMDRYYFVKSDYLNVK